MNSHICHVITTLGAGGAEQYVVQLSNHLLTQGHRVSIVAGEPQLLRERLSAGIHIETLRLHPGATRSLVTYLRILLPAIRRLVAYFRSEGVTVVHTHLAASALPAWIAAKICRIPVIHSRMYTKAIPSSYERILFASRLHLLFVNYFLAFTRYMEGEIRQYWRVPAERIVLSSIGVDTERFAPNALEREIGRRNFGIADGERVMLVVARFHPEKNVELAIRAARAMDDPGAVLLIVGDGPQRAFLEALVRDLLGRTPIRFLGLLQDPRPAYAAADVLVQTTRGPNLGTVVLEAMASGVPVAIAWRDEEERKMAEDTFDGLNLGVIARATPKSLASAMKALLDDRNRLQALRQEVRNFVERRHARQPVYQAMADFYMTLRPCVE